MRYYHPYSFASFFMIQGLHEDATQKINRRLVLAILLFVKSYLVRSISALTRTSRSQQEGNPLIYPYVYGSIVTDGYLKAGD